MRKILLVAALGLALAGCNAAQFIRTVQQGAVAFCGFEPAPAMIEAILKVITGLDTATVVNYVCQAANATRQQAILANRPGAPIAGAPSFTINGHRILVQGTFVR